MLPFLCVSLFVHGADPRELLYNFELLRPNHASKPKIEPVVKDRIEESFTRTIVAVPRENQVYLSWRLLRDDPENIGFNIERSEGGTWKRLNSEPIVKTCDFLDTDIEQGKTYEYRLLIGDDFDKSTETIKVVPGETSHYISVPLKDGIEPQRLGIGDLNGDGKFDFVVLHPNRGIDPAGSPNTDGLTYKLDAYLHDGTFLWRYDLGPGIEPGVWYSPFIIYDFDGDGKAEIALKTGENKPRDPSGRVTSGAEHLTILDGLSGKVLAHVDWPERSPRLGDYNRTNRNQLSIAWLDGKSPCILAMRGTYKAMFVHAWRFHNGSLESLWKWDGDEENPIVRSQGAHNSQIGDIDGDGRDEIVLGSAVLDDDGTLLWSAGLGHPDSIILTVVDPSRKGMQILYGVEVAHEKRGVCLVDARSGRQIWNIDRPTLHVGGAMAADIAPERPGLECFAAEDSKGGSRERYLLDAKGNLFGSGNDVPGTRHWIWWDADKLRETFSHRRGGQGFDIVKCKRETLTKEAFEGRIVMIGDIHGDWREEVITVLPGEIRVYSTDIPATDRRTTLLQDHKYRIDLVNASQGYYQSPTVSFYLGE